MTHAGPVRRSTVPSTWSDAPDARRRAPSSSAWAIGSGKRARQRDTACSSVSSSNAIGRPSTSASTRVCSRAVSGAGPVSAYVSPSCPGPVSARAATAATSRGSTHAVPPLPPWSARTTPSARIEGAQARTFDIGVRILSTVQASPESCRRRSLSRFQRAIRSSAAGSATASQDSLTA